MNNIYKQLLSGSRTEKFILSFLIFVGFFWFFYTNILIDYPFGQQFVYLADSFLHGDTYFRQLPVYIDVVEHQGKFYWHLGAFPAVLFIPPVFFFGTGFHTGLLQIIVNFTNFTLLFKIAEKLGVKRLNALWLAFAYVFASMYLQVGSLAISWYFAQIVATSLLLAAIHEFLNKQRWLLIGILTGLTITTRLHVGLGMVVFFGLVVFFNQKVDKSTVRNFLSFVTPIVLGVVMVGSYNFVRFGNVLETGYGKNTNFSYGPNETLATSDLAFSHNYGGMISYKFLASNFYYFFLKGFDPVLEKDFSHILRLPYFEAPTYGTGLFVAAPIFLFILLAPFKELLVRISYIASLVVLVILLLWFSVNYSSTLGAIGQRFLLDLTPYWFILLAFVFRKQLPNTIKALITVSFIINLYALIGVISKIPN